MSAENSATPERVNSPSLVQPQHLGPLSARLVIMCSICPPDKIWAPWKQKPCLNHLCVPRAWYTWQTPNKWVVNEWSVSPKSEGHLFHGHSGGRRVLTANISLALVTSKQQDCLGTRKMLPCVLHPLAGFCATRKAVWWSQGRSEPH